MALKTTLSAADVVHMATQSGRLDSFGYRGWRALAEYLDELSNDIGEDIEIDIVAICCDYSMVSSIEGYTSEYGIPGLLTIEEWEELDEKEKLEEIEKFLLDNTSLVHISDDMIIWQSF